MLPMTRLGVAVVMSAAVAATIASTPSQPADPGPTRCVLPTVGEPCPAVCPDDAPFFCAAVQSDNCFVSEVFAAQTCGEAGVSCLFCDAQNAGTLPGDDQCEEDICGDGTCCGDQVTCCGGIEAGPPICCPTTASMRGLGRNCDRAIPCYASDTEAQAGGCEGVLINGQRQFSLFCRP